LHRRAVLIISLAVPNRHPSLLNRLGHFIKGPNPLHPAVWEGRLSPLNFRRFQPEDVSQCLEIYKLNEPGRFPEGVLSEYEKSLREQRSYFLVAERNGQIVATSMARSIQLAHCSFPPKKQRNAANCSSTTEFQFLTMRIKCP